VKGLARLALRTSPTSDRTTSRHLAIRCACYPPRNQPMWSMHVHRDSLLTERQTLWLPKTPMRLNSQKRRSHLSVNTRCRILQLNDVAKLTESFQKRFSRSAMSSSVGQCMRGSNHMAGWCCDASPLMPDLNGRPSTDYKHCIDKRRPILILAWHRAVVASMSRRRPPYHRNSFMLCE
jgi:hypothetical protein